MIAPYQQHEPVKPSIDFYARHPEQIEQARVANSSRLTLAGMLVALGVNPKWLLLSQAIRDSVSEDSTTTASKAN